MTIVSLIFFGNVSCPNTIFSDKRCVHRNGFQSLGTSYHQCPHCTSMCQVRNIPFEGRRYSFYLKFGQRVHIFEEARKSIQDVIAYVDWPTCPNEECVYLLTNKSPVSVTVKSKKTALTCFSNIFKDQKLTFIMFDCDGTHCSCKKEDSWLRRRKTIFVREERKPPNTINHTRNSAKRGTTHSSFGIIASTPQWLINLTKKSSSFSFLHFQSTLKQHDFVSLQRRYWEVSRL